MRIGVRGWLRVSQSEKRAAISSAGGFREGVAFRSNPGGVAVSEALVRVQPGFGRVETGIDLRAAEFTDAALRTPGFTVGAEGEIESGRPRDRSRRLRLRRRARKALREPDALRALSAFSHHRFALRSANRRWRRPLPAQRASARRHPRMREPGASEGASRA